MIPKNITREHILKAMAEIDINGVPSHRHSTRWSVLHEGRAYPPKYVVSLANRYANGVELPAIQFDAGDARYFLKRRGFEMECRPV
jgi:5-methylcytosine-specific restriction enzyme A